MSNHSLRLAGFAALVTGLLVASGALVVAAPPTSCTAPELAAIDGELLKARVAIAAGDEETLQAALTTARDGLDEIVAACWDGPPASPGPDASAGPPSATVPPAELGATTTLGGYHVSHPADLVRVQTDLFRAVDRDGVAAEAITLADSDASGELLSGPLDAPVPEGFRVISLAIGDPIAALAATGGFQPDETPEGSPDAAIAELGDRIEAATADSDTRVTVTGSHLIAFPDGGEGAAIDIEFATAEGSLLATGRFAIRPLPTEDWALGVAVASGSSPTTLAGELEATLAAITGDEG